MNEQEEKKETMLKSLALTRQRALRTAAMNALSQTVSADQMVLSRWQQGEITSEEYLQIVGKTPVETLAEMHRNTLYSAALQMKNRVESGKITPEEYETITAMPYEFDLTGAVNAAVGALAGVVETLAIGVPGDHADSADEESATPAAGKKTAAKETDKA